MKMYCVKCRQERQIKNPENVALRNGRKAVKGSCSNCGTTIYKFVK